MALLTTGTFHTITFLPPTNAAYAALSPTVPGAQSGSSLAEALMKAAPDPVPAYIIDASTGLFATIGGQGYGFDDTVVDSSGAGTTFTLDADDGTTYIWCLDANGVDVYLYDSAAGLLRAFSPAEITALQAFLP